MRWSSSILLEGKTELDFCNELSIGTDEFYKSMTAGYKTLVKVEMRSVDYNDAKSATYNDESYDIIRTYKRGSGEFVELTLSDLSGGSVIVG